MPDSEFTGYRISDARLLPNTGYSVPVIRPDNRILRPDTGYFSDFRYTSFLKQNFFNNSIVLFYEEKLFR